MGAHSLLFARLPDLCGGDGNTQYVIARSDMNIFKAFLMDHVHGQLRDVKVGPIDESDYAKTAVHPESDAYTKEFKDLNETAGETYQKERLYLADNHMDRVDMASHTGWKEGQDEKYEVLSSNDISGTPLNRLAITRYGRTQGITIDDLIHDPQVRLYEERLRCSDQLQVICDEPVKEGEKWAAFPMHDGDHIVIIPKEDMLQGNATREKVFHMPPDERYPRAMVYPHKNYMVMDMKSREKNIFDGKSVMDMLRAPTIRERKEMLKNLSENIAKNIGTQAVIPVLPKKRSGR